MIFTSVDGAPALEQDVRARIDQQVMLHAAVAIKTSRGCTVLAAAPAIDTRCRVAAPPEGTRVRWLKVEADRAAYDNVPQGEFHAAEIGWIESEWAEGWSLAADVRPVVRRGIDAPA